MVMDHVSFDNSRTVVEVEHNQINRVTEDESRQHATLIISNVILNT